MTSVLLTLPALTSILPKRQRLFRSKNMENSIDAAYLLIRITQGMKYALCKNPQCCNDQLSHRGL